MVVSFVLCVLLPFVLFIKMFRSCDNDCYLYNSIVPILCPSKQIQIVKNKGPSIFIDPYLYRFESEGNKDSSQILSLLEHFVPKTFPPLMSFEHTKSRIGETGHLAPECNFLIYESFNDKKKQNCETR